MSDTDTATPTDDELRAASKAAEAELARRRQARLDAAEAERLEGLRAGPPATAPTGLVRFLVTGVSTDSKYEPVLDATDLAALLKRGRLMPEVHAFGFVPGTLDTEFVEALVTDRELDLETVEWVWDRFSEFGSDGEDRPAEDGPFVDCLGFFGVHFDGGGTRVVELDQETGEPA